jgi:hypothetical protein
MRRRRKRGLRDPLLLAIAVGGVLAIVGLTIAPRGYESGWLLAVQDDAAAVAEHEVSRSLTPAVATREIVAALARDDADLANSFVDLARDSGIALDPALIAKVDAANATSATAMRNAQRFAQGLFTGEPDDMVGLAGTALGDLFVFGDIRDALREGVRLANGEQVDELILGLSIVGLAVTAGTYASMGVGAPARIGLSLTKAARKTGRIGSRLADLMTRSVREVVDWSAARKAFANASLTEPAVIVRAAREAIKVEKAGGVMRVMGDIGTVQAKAGTQAALEGLRFAETPRDVARLAKIAEKHGTKTRAILKLAGRAAIAFTFAAFDLALWLFGLAFALLGFCSAVKSTTERGTLRYVRWRKRRRSRRLARELERQIAENHRAAHQQVLATPDTAV